MGLLVMDYRNQPSYSFLTSHMVPEERLWFLLALAVFFVLFELKLLSICWGLSMGGVLRYLWFLITGRILP